jgi:Leucine-rich repeat (LRR) protein
MPPDEFNEYGWQTNAAGELRRAREFGSEWLSLANAGLTTIPDEFFELTNLVTLDLNGNHLRSIPQRLWDLPKLRDVRLLGNPIETLPNRSGLTIDLSTYLRCLNHFDRNNVTLFIGTRTTQEEVDGFAAALKADLPGLWRQSH